MTLKIDKLSPETVSKFHTLYYSIQSELESFSDKDAYAACEDLVNPDLCQLRDTLENLDDKQFNLIMTTNKGLVTSRLSTTCRGSYYSFASFLEISQFSTVSDVKLKLRIYDGLCRYFSKMMSLRFPDVDVRLYASEIRKDKYLAVSGIITLKEKNIYHLTFALLMTAKILDIIISSVNLVLIDEITKDFLNKDQMRMLTGSIDPLNRARIRHEFRKNFISAYVNPVKTSFKQSFDLLDVVTHAKTLRNKDSMSIVFYMESHYNKFYQKMFYKDAFWEFLSLLLMIAVIPKSEFRFYHENKFDRPALVIKTSPEHLGKVKRDEDALSIESLELTVLAAIEKSIYLTYLHLEKHPEELVQYGIGMDHHKVYEEIKANLFY